MQSGKFVLRLTNCGSRLTKNAHVAQLVEHVLGKDEVTRSIRVVGSRLDSLDPHAHESVSSPGDSASGDL